MKKNISIKKAPVITKNIRTLDNQVDYLWLCLDQEKSRFEKLSKWMSSVETKSSLDIVFLYCSKVRSIKNIRHDLHLFLHCRKISVDHSHYQRVCAGIMHCQWVKLFASRAEDPNDEHLQALRNFMQSDSKKSVDLHEAMTNLYEEISEKFLNKPDSLLTLPFRTINTIKQSEARKSVIHTITSAGLESILSHASIEADYNVIDDELSQYSLDKLQLIQSQLDKNQIPKIGTPSFNFYTDQYILSQTLKLNEGGSQQSKLFDRCRNLLLICGEYAQLIDEVINVIQSFSLVVQQKINHKKLELNSIKKQSRQDNLQDKQMRNQAEFRPNPWIKVGASSQYNVLRSQLKSVRKIHVNSSVLISENSPPLDEPESKNIQKKEAAKLTKSSKTKVNKAKVSFDNELFIDSFINKLEQTLTLFEKFMLFYSHHQSSIKFNCNDVQFPAHADGSNEPIFTSLKLDSFLAFKNASSPTEKKASSKKKNNKKKSHIVAKKSLFDQLKQSLNTLLMNYVETKKVSCIELNAINLHLMFDGSEFYFGEMNSSQQYHGNGLSLIYHHEEMSNVRVGLWDKGKCDAFCLLSNAMFQVTQNNSLVVTGVFCDQKNGEIDCINDAVLRYSDGIKAYGDWKQVKENMWDLVGKGRIEYERGAVVTGEWGAKEDGRSHLVGNGTIKNKNGELCVGLWGNAGEGKRVLTGDGYKMWPDGRKVGGTWRVVEGRQMCFSGRGYKTSVDGVTKYGTWGYRDSGKWDLIGEGQINYPCGYKSHGTWGNIGEEKYHFVGKGFAENDNGVKVFGTWGNQSDGTRTLVGQIRREYPDGRQYEGVVGYNECGKWDFVGTVKLCRNGKTAYGNWANRGNGEWGIVGEARVEEEDGAVVYGEFKEKEDGSWNFVANEANE